MLASKQLRRRHLVLVVEDQEINRDVLGMILEDDYDVIYAENGAEGLEQMYGNLDRLSIVLLDLMMPVMDGFEVLRHMRGDPWRRKWQPTPIFFFSFRFIFLLKNIFA